MTLVRYNRPRTNFVSRNFSDIMDEFFNDVVNTKQDSFVPGIDISESENQFHITVGLPGIKKEDININLENGRLAISGERKFEQEKEGKTYHRVETQYGSFNRSFQLPDSINEDSIKASYKDGLLSITVDKAEDKVKKQIEIK